MFQDNFYFSKGGSFGCLLYREMEFLGGYLSSTFGLIVGFCGMSRAWFGEDRGGVPSPNPSADPVQQALKMDA